MSEARAGAMGKIQAMIDGHSFTIDNPDLITEDMQLDQAASVQSNKELLEEQRLLQAKLKTESDIQRLEEAKRKASSQKVKDDIAAEVALIKSEKLKAEQEEKEQLENSTPTDVAKDKVADAFNAGKKKVKKQVDRVSQVGKEAWDGLGNVATPGSIFLPVSVLIIFFLLLLPVNGHTRIEWLWLALTGNAHIDIGGSADFGNTPQQSVQGGGADFGTSLPVSRFTGPSEVF